MVNRFIHPRPAFWSSTAPYAGGRLYFYVAGTSTPQDTYSDSGLTTENLNPIVLNAAGYPDTSIFLADAAYKVVLKDSSDGLIWSEDNVWSSDYSATAQFRVYAGNPNGNVAGTAGSGSIPADAIWDTTNSILYICTTTGTAVTAAWSAVNAVAATQTFTQPQGRLTLTSATPVLSSDVSGASTVYYTPYIGNQIPLYNGASTVPVAFSELSLSLVSQHAASTIYDVFVFNNSGVLTLVTGPAWSSSTAGSSSRGTGGGTTQITRLNGVWVNAVQITGRNGSTTYTISANLATYVGSILCDGSAGQVTCHLSYGQSRKWGIWNAYNRQLVIMKAGDGTASWSYSTATIRQSRADSNNRIQAFTGLPEEMFEATFSQRMTGGNSTPAQVGIGWDSTTAFSGHAHVPESNLAVRFIMGRHVNAPVTGLSNVNMLEKGDTGGSTFFGGEDDCYMTLSYRG